MAKRNLQAQVPADHAARVRNTVAGMQRILGGRYTLTQFLIDATEAHCHALEVEHNAGRPWPQMGEGLQPGARLQGRDRSRDDQR